MVPPYGIRLYLRQGLCVPDALEVISCVDSSRHLDARSMCVVEQRIVFRVWRGCARL